MQYFPLKTLILCIVLPPLLFIASIQIIEQYLQGRYTNEIEEIYIGDTTALLNGSITIGESITHNIDRYLRSKKVLGWGVKAVVTVRTPANSIIYPAAFGHTDTLEPQKTPLQVAKENYAALNQGFVISVEAAVVLHQILSFVILSFYIFLSILIFWFSYQKSSRKVASEYNQIQVEIDRLQISEAQHQEKLLELNRQKHLLSAELTQVQEAVDTEKEKASATEDEMIDEIERLETSIEDNVRLQIEQEEEIEALRSKLSRYEKETSKDMRQKQKASQTYQKRFRTLYKSLRVSDRAVSGFGSLTTDLQLKAEEIMLQLHDDPKLVPIKRKVFGKKNRETVFEVLFAYKGRLYYRTTQEQKIEVVAIGTKHTQTKDLKFLDQL